MSLLKTRPHYATPWKRGNGEDYDCRQVFSPNKPDGTPSDFDEPIASFAHEEDAAFCVAAVNNLGDAQQRLRDAVHTAVERSKSPPAPCQFEPVNLDDQPEEDLEAISLVFPKLARYAAGRHMAKVHRKAGRIETAVAIERKLEAIYAELPGWARW